MASKQVVEEARRRSQPCVSDFAESALPTVASLPSLHGKTAAKVAAEAKATLWARTRTQGLRESAPAATSTSAEIDEHRHQHHPRHYYISDTDLSEQTLMEIQELRSKYWAQQNLANLDIDVVSKDDAELVWSKATAWQIRGIMPKPNALGWCVEKPYTRRGFESPCLREDAEELLDKCGIGAVNAKGLKGFNDRSLGQDSLSVSKLDNGWEVFIVADGHGPDGQWPASEAARVLPYFLQRQEVLRKLDSGKVPEVLRWCFYKTEEHLEHHGQLEHVKLFLSGTTLTCCLRNPQQRSIWVAHVGDSTALLLQPSKDILSTVDHTPAVPAERQRVADKGCQMEPEQGDDGEPGPERIYLPNKDYPGILMSRSMGDLCVKQFGVVAEPDVVEWSYEPSQGALYLACSDGVWEFLDKKDVAQFVQSKIAAGTSPREVADELASMAFKSWEKLGEAYVDDITVLLVPLDIPALPNAEHRGFFLQEACAKGYNMVSSRLRAVQGESGECASGVCKACVVQ